MIRRAADLLAANGYADIRADLPAMDRPASISWSSTGLSPVGEIVPDVTGARNGLPAVFEVETGDSIFHRHTAEEWTLFSKYAEKTRARFTVVVPMGSRQAAERRLKDLRLKAEVWEL
ncbi:MAG TPA: hypothetical protein VNX25_04010 [Verrucomicrobiae bacterium]|nr:hypothetical protein [Verrucomicrobiae bacterium]